MLAVFIYSCTADFETLEHGHRNDDLVSWNTFKRETGITNARGDLQTEQFVKNAPQFRGVELSDFEIDTTYILKYVNDAGKSTYSFSVRLLEPIDEKTLYNLVFRKENEVWEKSVVSFELENNNPKSLVNIQTTFDGGTAFSIDNIIWCFSIITNSHCTNEPGFCVPTCDRCAACETQYLTAYPCGSGVGPSGPSISGPPPTGGGAGGSGGSSSGSQYDFAPNIKDGSTVIGDGNTSLVTVPCITAKAMSSRAVFKQKFNELNVPENLNANYETGFGEQQIDGSVSFPDGEPLGQTNILFDQGVYGITHVHPTIPYTLTNGTVVDVAIKVPSIEDLQALVTSLREASLSGTTLITPYHTAISNDGIFSLQLSDTALEGWQAPTDEEWDKLKKDYSDECLKVMGQYLYASSPQQIAARNSGLQSILLDFIKKIGLANKVSLMEGVVENNEINWSQVKKSSNGQIRKQRC